MGARSPRRRSRAARSSSRWRPRRRTAPRSGCAVWACPIRRGARSATCTRRCASSCPFRWTRRRASGRRSNPADRPAPFAAPVILLGCVSPFAIRLLLRDVETGGNTAGRVYALSTAGSILGTFLPVFWFIPTYGTRPTLEGFGLVLVGVSIAGLWPRRRLYASFAAAVILAWALLPSGIKPPASGTLITEQESGYNYIQIVRVGAATELIHNA